MNVYPLTTVHVLGDGEGGDTHWLFVTLLVIMFVSSLGLLVAAKRYQWL